MRFAIMLVRALVGITGVAQVLLGVLFWTGHALTLVSLHMVIGAVFVLALITLAVLCARAGVHPGLVAMTIAWSLVIPAFGMLQMGILPGPFHWVVRVAHLLTGMIGMGLASTLFARARALPLLRGVDPGTRVAA